MINLFFAGMVSAQFRQQSPQVLQLQFQEYQLQQQRKATSERPSSRRPGESIQQQFRQQKQQQQSSEAPPSQNAVPNESAKPNQKPPQVTSVQDLFNTTSCVDPPFKCPHPRIQFFLYTRYVCK